MDEAKEFFACYCITKYDDEGYSYPHQYLGKYLNLDEVNDLWASLIASVPQQNIVDYGRYDRGGLHFDYIGADCERYIVGVE
jgi:hypothetical protein